jgi:TonB family protein
MSTVTPVVETTSVPAASPAVGRGRGSGTGTGSGIGTGMGVGSSPASDGQGVGAGRSGPSAITKQLRIVSKPRPVYTDLARSNAVQGSVLLRITFLASGQIGSVTVVKALPYGLTEQAIAAARLIKFEPAESTAGPVTVTKVVEYTFDPY